MHTYIPLGTRPRLTPPPPAATTSPRWRHAPPWHPTSRDFRSATGELTSSLELTRRRTWLAMSTSISRFILITTISSSSSFQWSRNSTSLGVFIPQNSTELTVNCAPAKYNSQSASGYRKPREKLDTPCSTNSVNPRQMCSYSSSYRNEYRVEQRLTPGVRRPTRRMSDASCKLRRRGLSSTADWSAADSVDQSATTRVRKRDQCETQQAGTRWWHLASRSELITVQVDNGKFCRLTIDVHRGLLLPARRSKRGLCYGNVSVRPSVCHSRYCV